MCTVTIFYKGNTDFVLTSNRDEAPNRTAIAPAFYSEGAAELLLPKDKQSGGSWIGASNNNRIVCLLNGGYKIHKRKAKYRKSRGVVVKDLLTVKSIESAISVYNFEDIEPFTIIIADWNLGLLFFELVWDGKKIYLKKLPLETEIWSSSTLYTKEKKQARRDWFETFKSENKLSSESLLDFHQTAGNDNSDYGVIMDRRFVKTTSITQIEKSDSIITMTFHDLKTLKKTVKTLKISETV